MKATRSDVAKLAGVSTATVSYVLNKSKTLSPETTERVMRAVRELNYRPDIIARSMSTRESMQIGILLENISNPFYGDIIRGFESSANKQGYFVNVCTSLRRYNEYIEGAIARRLDGLFIMALPTSYDMEKLYHLTEQDIGVIVSGCCNADLKRLCLIENDYLTAMRDAMLHLHQRGHRDIAFITGLDRSLTFDNRVSGYLRMVEELGLTCGDDLLIEGRPPYSTAMQDGYDLTQRLLKTRRRFTALICVNDLTAFGAYMALRENGLRIPEDVAVVGFDDILFSSFCSPTLTTLSVDKFAFGQKAFELLYSYMTQGNTGFYLNRLRLVERQSTAVQR